jgi:urea transport system substrate-binding protein
MLAFHKSAAALAAAAALLAATPSRAQETIKVGILHSLSGTMAISETTLKDTMLFLIEEQNKKGGLLGKKLEAVVVDPASNWPLFAEKARELISKDKVSAVFGCWTSVSRKSVLPVFKEYNMRGKNPSATCSIRVLLLTSRPFQPSTI